MRTVPAPAPLGIADIKAMAKSGVSDEVIISQIRSVHAVYHLTTAEILDLKDTGVSQKVIDFMINTPNTTSAPEVMAGTPPPPPPPPTEEVIVCPGPEYIWVTGSYTWVGGRWVWVGGRWVLPPHPHAVWVSGGWVRYRGGYGWHGGHWR